MPHPGQGRGHFVSNYSDNIGARQNAESTRALITCFGIGARQNAESTRALITCFGIGARQNADSSLVFGVFFITNHPLSLSYFSIAS
ncbi:MAG: hypothetical protein A3H42_03305 [Deltaproteobacteria bacterium RIFCSPLOWO2_02_FULL_46_8]|nr:MAG: hypothetical protein A3H42_03305 [Deltaproteobacteria bacterium RIFCSPLOWO2_02_FULL_46_8]